MVYCPHTFDPQGHSLKSQSQDPTECDTCGGYIQTCNNPNCNAPNRLAANFCTMCGGKLATNVKLVDDTELVRGVTRRINDSSEYRLDRVLNYTSNDTPFLWLPSKEGIFVFTFDQNAKEGRVSLYYVPSYKFKQAFTKCLTDDAPLPAYSQWIQEPLQSKHGLFIPTETGLYYFPTHGNNIKYKQNIWNPSSGEIILSIALQKSGQPSILVKDKDSNLIILEGNTQSGVWGENDIHCHILKYEMGSGSAYIFTNPNLSNDYFIYDGITLIQYNPTGRKIESKAEISEAPIPTFLKDKLSKAYFTPFVLEDKTHGVRSIIPVKYSTDNYVKICTLPKSVQTPRKIDSEKKHLWVKPSPDGESFVVGFPDAIKGYVSQSSLRWEIETVDEPNSQNFPAIMMQNWFALLLSYTGAGAKKITAIMFEPAGQDKGVYIPDYKKRMTGILDKSGEPMLGLPPLYSNGNIFLALAKGKNRQKIVTVYQIQASG